MIFCYIDPGTGSALIQIIVATIAGITLSAKNVRIYLKGILQNMFKKQNVK